MLSRNTQKTIEKTVEQYYEMLRMIPSFPPHYALISIPSLLFDIFAKLLKPHEYHLLVLQIGKAFIFPLNLLKMEQLHLSSLKKKFTFILYLKEKILHPESPLHRISFHEYNALINQINAFQDARNDIYHIEDANDAAAFIKFLKLNTKTAVLDTLIKLGADKQDCDMAPLVERLITVRQPHGVQSLAWQCAKKLTETKRVPSQLIPDEAANLLEDARKLKRRKF